MENKCIARTDSVAYNAHIFTVKMESSPQSQPKELKLAGDEVGTLLTERAFNSLERYSALVMNYLIARFATATCVYARSQATDPAYVLRTVLPSSSTNFRNKLLDQIRQSTSEKDFFQRWVALHNHTHGPIIRDAQSVGIEAITLAKLWQQSMTQILNWAKTPSFHIVFHPLKDLENHVISRPHIILPLQAGAFNRQSISVTLQPQFIISSLTAPSSRVVDYRTFLPAQTRIEVAILNALAAKRYLQIPSNNRRRGGEATTVDPINLDFLDPSLLLPYRLNLLANNGRWNVTENLLNGGRQSRDNLSKAMQHLISRLASVFTQTDTLQRNSMFWTPHIAPFFPTEAELEKYEPKPKEEQLELQFPEP